MTSRNVLAKLAKQREQIKKLKSEIERLSEWFDDSLFSGGRPTVQVRKTGDYELPIPKYETDGAAGFDLRAFQITDWRNFPETKALAFDGGTISFGPGQMALFSTGLEFNIPDGYHGRVTLRSSMWSRGFAIPQSVGVIDSDYRGEVKIPVISYAGSDATIEYGERIAQMVVTLSPQAEIIECESLKKTDRGNAGFGSTGSK